MPFHGHTLLWGFTHDWLQDDYYEKFHFAQWRVKLGMEWGPWNEIRASGPPCPTTATRPNIAARARTSPLRP